MSRYRRILNVVALLGVITLASGALPVGIVLRVDAADGLGLVGGTAFTGVLASAMQHSGEAMSRSDETAPGLTELNVVVRASESSSVTVEPGSEVHYEIVSELSGNANEGLAFFQFDLEFDGDDLPQADSPTDPPMSSFVIPDGFTNPAGFGGATDVPGREGDLVQVGGCQNVINNTADDAPYPIGPVITGIAWPGSPEVLVTGTLTAPTDKGTYTLRVTNLTARVIRQSETGDSFWATEATGPGAITNLTIHVSTSEDCNSNGIPDECDIDCAAQQGACNVTGCGQSSDNNEDGVPDECVSVIPTSSACGLVAMTSLLLTAGALVVARCRLAHGQRSTSSKNSRNRLS